jgi:hypothetical protein
MRAGTYDRNKAFAAGAPLTRRHFVDALQSWSVWPAYLSLVALYVIGVVSVLLSKFALTAH